MELTDEDVRQILKLIEESKELEEFDLACGSVHLHVRRHGGGQAAMPVPASPRVAAEIAPQRSAALPVPRGMVAVRAPMLGTFYRASSPEASPFVEVGKAVKASDPVCLIEVMKLFNSISAGVDGSVVEIRAQNGSLVEFDEVLIVIDPSKK